MDRSYPLRFSAGDEQVYEEGDAFGSIIELANQANASTGNANQGKFEINVVEIEFKENVKLPTF